MSIDDPMGGIFSRLGMRAGQKESADTYRRENLEVACVKKILTWAFQGKSITNLLRTARDESATGNPNFAWLNHQFSGFPLQMVAVDRIRANWHITNIWGNQFAKHPMFVLYHEIAEQYNVNLDEEKFALLTRCTNFDGSSILAMHNLKVAVDTTVNVAEHDGGDKHNTRIVRVYRNRLYCIEDLLSMMALVGRAWAGND